MLTEVSCAPFETVVDSAVVGSVKPDARIFQIALERLSLGPAEVMMIGTCPRPTSSARARWVSAPRLDPTTSIPWKPRASSIFRTPAAALLAARSEPTPHPDPLPAGRGEGEWESWRGV